MGRISGGFDSYTKVSSESDELAASTALATLDSNISAFDVTDEHLASTPQLEYFTNLFLLEEPAISSPVFSFLSSV